MALWLAMTPAVARAAPVTVGQGSHPQVAVDATGTGYITWIETTSSSDTFHYCKLPVGATACAARFSFSDANQDVDGGYAFVADGNRVLLIEARGVSPSTAKDLWTSTDGGATFAGPVQVGTLTHSGNGIAGEALLAPPGTLGLGSEAIFTIGQLGATTAPFQATATSAGSTSSDAELTPNVAAGIGLQGNTLLAALSDFSQLSWTRYAGPIPATVETLNNAANWSAPAAIGPRSGANLETPVASGPSGIFVGYVVDAGAGGANFVARQFTGTGWSAPVVIAPDAAHPDLSEDAGGNLRAIWKDTHGLRYRYTTNGRFSEPVTLTSSPGESYAFPRVASNATGTGWAVYAGSPGVQAVPLIPSPYSGPSRTVGASGFGATYQLKVPRGCLSPGQRFRVTLKWRKQRRKGNLFVKIRRTDFYLGTKRLKKDTRVPFVYTFQVLVTQPRGSTITLRARAFIKVRHGKTPKKSLRAKLKVCA